MSSQQLTPEVLWAQRSSASDPAKNYVFLTISVPDVPKDKLKLDVQPTKVTFTGESGSKKQTYHVELELYAEIDPSETKTHHTGKNVELVLRKKEAKEEFWPRLLKENKKMHFLKTDFDKWVDEDEQNEAPEDDDYMSKMGGMPGGMGGMGGEDGGFGGIDFSKLGGMGGMDMGAMGGMGGMGGDDAGDEDDDEDDDDDMPELEEAGDKKPAAAAEGSKSKIEEVE